MSGRRIGGILCFILAAASLVSGINVVSRGIGLTNASGLGVSRAVGAFLPCLLLLAVGLRLFQKPGP